MSSASQNSPLPASEESPEGYAHNQHLTVDCSTVDICGHLNSLSNYGGPATFLYDEGDLRQVQIPSVFMTESIGIPRSSIELLRQMEAEKDHLLADLFPPAQVRRAGRAKLEPPLLLTDPELDYIEFKKTVEAKMRVQIPENSLPAEPLDTSADESMEFPESAYAHRAQLMSAIRNERLAVGKDTFKLLAQTLQNPKEELEMDSYIYKNVTPSRASSRSNVARRGLLMLPLEEKKNQANASSYTAHNTRRLHTECQDLYDSTVLRSKDSARGRP